MRRDAAVGRVARFGFGVAVVGMIVGVAILVLRPAGESGLYASVPAALTLLGVSGRLVLAVHDTRRTSDALARSHTDNLTGLPNRGGFRERIDLSIARGSGLVLAVLDLDGFKEINDALGHIAGDVVINLVGVRIRRVVPAFATVARLGGDEFGILAPRRDIELMSETARDVLRVLGEPISLEGIDITPTASIGIVSWAAGEAVDSTELLRRAEVAMYLGKGGSRSTVVHYDPRQDGFSKDRLRIADELRRAIPNGEIEVWYQPQIDASTMRTCAVEALVRWRHPTDGLLSPIAFLPAARRAGLMPLVSAEIVRRAVADAAGWWRAGLDLRVAVNCAPPELLSGMFVPRLFDAITAAGLPPDRIVLEVTEDSFIGEPERAHGLIQDVRDFGIQVAIDDYGTGFSSLAYLRDYSVDELKLDRSFVSAIGVDDRSRMIVASTIQLAEALGLRTVAEGVEDPSTAADLIAMGVTALQGFRISRPMPAAEVPGWVYRWPLFADARLSSDAAVSRPLQVEQLAR
jgi:diguanylate cyclase (GGDEF)-like protein